MAAFLIIAQYCVGILLMFLAFLLVRKQARVTSYLLPWIFTIGTLLDLPLRTPVPLPPFAIHCIVALNSLETFILLVITGANSMITAVCLLFQALGVAFYTSNLSIF